MFDYLCVTFLTVDLGSYNELNLKALHFKRILKRDAVDSDHSYAPKAVSSPRSHRLAHRKGRGPQRREARISKFATKEK